MRLTFFGSSLVSSYWNGAATYYRGLLRALADRGHEIVFCEPDAFDRQAHRDLDRDPEYARVLVYDDEAQRDALLEDAFADSDWVIKCSGVGVWDAELERAVAEGSGGRARTAFWDVDAPATLERLANNPDDPFHQDVGRYDRIFTYGGGPPVVAAYERFGARACTPVYNALDPEEHRPPDRSNGAKRTDGLDGADGAANQDGADGQDDAGSQDGADGYGVLFMGNRLPDRESRVDRFFFDAARAAPDVRFALGGAGWDDKPMPDNVDYLGHIPTADHNRVNSSALLVLNIHRESMVENGWSPATRMFEAAGAAACQVTDPWRGIEDFFDPVTEILVAEDGAAVAEYARSIERRQARAIGEASRRRALAEHTYSRRAEEVDAILRG